MNMLSDIKGTSHVKQTARAAEVARLLGDQTRLNILALLFHNRDGMCVYEIAEEVGSSPSATSHQLAKLEAHGIVVCYREGQKMCYELTKTPLVFEIEKILRLLSVL